MLEINWEVFQENIAILGMQGTGKTTMATRLLDRVPNVPRIIISPINRASWQAYGAPVQALHELQGPGAYLWAGPNSQENFEKICSIIMDKMPNTIVVIDDLQEYVSKQKIPDALSTLIQSGRNRGICSIWLSPSPNLISNHILQSAQHILAFRMNLESQIDWLARNYFGPDAWALLPRERRKQTPELGADLDVFPKYAFLYRHYTETKNQLIMPEGPE